MGIKDEEEKGKAGEAIMTVLSAMQNDEVDTYCLAERFVAKGIEDFENWEDISVASKKFGLPKDFEGGAKKHD